MPFEVEPVYLKLSYYKAPADLQLLQPPNRRPPRLPTTQQHQPPQHRLHTPPPTNAQQN